MSNTIQIKITLTEEVYKVLESRAEALGIKTSAYIRLVLGTESRKEG